MTHYLDGAGNAGPMMAGTALHADPMWVLADAINRLVVRLDELEKRLDELEGRQTSKEQLA